MSPVSCADALVNFFGTVATDAALVEELKQLGPLSWCPQDESDVERLAQALEYLTKSRGLPIPTIRAIQSTFALTQASLITCGLFGILSVSQQEA